MSRTIPLGCAFLMSCGGTALSHDGADAGGASASAPPAQICDGSANVRLAVRLSGGGQIGAGSAMLGENGWQFLLVDGSCQAWILEAHTDALRHLTLSHEREEALSRALRLSDWTSLMGQHYGGCSDGPGISYRFDQVRIAGSECGLTPGDPLEGVNTAFNAQLELLYAEATPSSGDIRYLVIRGDDSLVIDQRIPIPWPLAVPLESVSIAGAEASQFMPGRSQRATGDDASKLRAIRSTHASTSPGPAPDSTPVVGADGIPAALYARDAAPFEGENGLIADGVF